MRKLCVIGWRPHGQAPWFLRGGNEPHVFLPKITDDLVWLVSRPNAKGLPHSRFNGWVTNIAWARVFDIPVYFDTKRSFHPDLDLDRVQIYPYDSEVLPTQIYRPIRFRKRPQ
jgi:hypothetical protein